MPRPLLITSGEPAGIGPEISLQAIYHAQQQRLFNWPLVVVGDPELLSERASALDLSLELVEWHSDLKTELQKANQVWVWPTALAIDSKAGQLNPANSQYVINTLNIAAGLCLEGKAAGVVTAPVQKSVIVDAGIAFSGHTEHFQALAAVDQVVMMLATKQLRVALATTHLPLSEVPAAIQADTLETSLRILVSSLKSEFNCVEPTVLVAGLNPHAGESGHLGREEIEVIQPVLDTLRLEGMQLQGPLPADTLFTPAYLEQADAVLAMYHDQGLPVLKSQGFGEAVNITLGLPFVRTSVDHGTALDLAGTGRASYGSMMAAIEMAATLAQHS